MCFKPRGGMFLWCQLPDGLDATDVARPALTDNIVLAPGNIFSVSQTATRFLRFNVAQSSDPGVFAAVERAMQGGSGAANDRSKVLPVRAPA